MTDTRTRDAAQTLDTLLRSRYHGASNVAGIRFQLLYSLLRAFDLYGDGTIGEVVFEGIEDVDLRRRPGEGVLQKLRIGNAHVQVKHSTSAKTWGWFDREEILDHFIAVYQLDRSAIFVLVTDFPLRGPLDELARFCNGQVQQLSPALAQKVRAIAKRANLAATSIPAFLPRIKYTRISEEELVKQLRAAIVRHFDVTAGNEALYLARLVECSIDWAAGRVPVRLGDLEAERLRVTDWIGLGVENPAVRDRLIEPLNLVADDATEDASP